MAKKKKSATKKKKVGTTKSMLNPTSPIVQFGSIGLGFLMGAKINEAIDKATGGKVDTKIVAGGQVGIGYLLALKKGGKASLVKTIAGGVLLGSGIKRALTAFGVGSIGGYQAVPVIGSPMSGYQNVPVVGNARKMGGYALQSGGINGYNVPRPMKPGSVIGGITKTSGGNCLQ